MILGHKQITEIEDRFSAANESHDRLALEALLVEIEKNTYQPTMNRSRVIAAELREIIETFN